MRKEGSFSQQSRHRATVCLGGRIEDLSGFCAFCVCGSSSEVHVNLHVRARVTHVCVKMKRLLMGSGIIFTFSPWCASSHTCTLALTPYPSTTTPLHFHFPPTNLISGMPHAEPSANTGAQCDSHAQPHPPTPNPTPTITPGTSYAFSSLQMQPHSRLHG